MDEAEPPPDDAPPSAARGLLAWCALWSVLAVAGIFAPPFGTPSDPSGVGPGEPLLGEGDRQFSAPRAQAHVEALAAAPRPSGSPENIAAREHVVASIEALGLQARVDRFTSADLELANVSVRLPGGGPEAERDVVLLMAHFDSRSDTPGAGDDAAGTAVLLETLRALTRSPALRNDVLFLWTDGEERGLLGARAFVQLGRHEEVDLVVNVEARGNAGPPVLFETGPENGWFVREVARGAGHPVGSSLGKTVYDNMPNDTDYSPFRDLGIPGLNFALVCGATVYHRPPDTPESLSSWSLAHHGSNALSLARHFGELELDDRAEPDVLFFNLLGPVLVTAPTSWALPVTGLLTLVVLVLAGAFAARGGGRAVLVGLAVSVGVALGTAAASAALALGLDAAGGAVVEVLGRAAPERGNAWSAGVLFVSLALLTLATASSLLALLAARLSRQSLPAAAWWSRLALAFLGLAAANAAVGTTYAVALPLAGALLVPADGEGRVARLRAAVGALPVALFVVPAALFVFMVASPLVLPAVIAIAVVLSGFQTLHVPWLGRVPARERWIVLALGALLALAAGALRALGS